MSTSLGENLLLHSPLLEVFLFLWKPGELRGPCICLLPSLLPQTFQKLLSNPEETGHNCLNQFPLCAVETRKLLFVASRRVCVRGWVEGNGHWDLPLLSRGYIRSLSFGFGGRRHSRSLIDSLVLGHLAFQRLGHNGALCIPPWFCRLTPWGLSLSTRPDSPQPQFPANYSPASNKMLPCFVLHAFLSSCDLVERSGWLRESDRKIAWGSFKPLFHLLIPSLFLSIPFWQNLC